MSSLRKSACRNSRRMTCLTSKALKHIQIMYFCDCEVCPVRVTLMLFDMNACGIVRYIEMDAPELRDRKISRSLVALWAGTLQILVDRKFN